MPAKKTPSPVKSHTAGSQPQKNRKKKSGKSEKPEGFIGVARSPRTIRPHFKTQPGPNATLRVSGCDYVGPLASGGLTDPVRGAVLMKYSIAPRAMSNSKLSTISTMYERYQFRSIRFHYRPSCATTQPGSLLFFIDKDIIDPI